MGIRLKRLREGRGLTQAELAKRADVPLGSLRNYEQGHRTPLLDQAAKIAAALGVSLDALVSDHGEAEKTAPKTRRTKREKS